MNICFFYFSEQNVYLTLVKSLSAGEPAIDKIQTPSNCNYNYFRKKRDGKRILTHGYRRIFDITSDITETIALLDTYGHSMVIKNDWRKRSEASRSDSVINKQLFFIKYSFSPKIILFWLIFITLGLPWPSSADSFQPWRLATQHMATNRVTSSASLLNLDASKCVIRCLRQLATSVSGPCRSWFFHFQQWSSPWSLPTTTLLMNSSEVCRPTNCWIIPEELDINPFFQRKLKATKNLSATIHRTKATFRIQNTSCTRASCENSRPRRWANLSFRSLLFSSAERSTWKASEALKTSSGLQLSSSGTSFTSLPSLFWKWSPSTFFIYSKSSSTLLQEL